MNLQTASKKTDEIASNMSTSVQEKSNDVNTAGKAAAQKVDGLEN